MAAWSKCETGPQPTGHALFHWQVWIYQNHETWVSCMEQKSFISILTCFNLFHNINLFQLFLLGDSCWKLRILRRTESIKQLSVFLGAWELPKIPGDGLRSPYQVWWFILHQRFHRRFREMLFDDAEPTTPGPFCERFSFQKFTRSSFGRKKTCEIPKWTQVKDNFWDVGDVPSAS